MDLLGAAKIWAWVLLIGLILFLIVFALLHWFGPWWAFGLTMGPMLVLVFLLMAYDLGQSQK